MPARPPSSTLLAAALAAVVAGPALAQDPSNPTCPARFQLYETATQVSGPAQNQRNLSASTQVTAAARWLRMGNCLTFSAQLASMATLGPEAGAAARAPSGPTTPPTWLHVGIVTSTADEARAIDFFVAQGLRARSVGAALLGRRIYVGPFTTLGALEGGAALAQAAGFAYPYPASF
jgi:hypothetical protein